ncbi:MAG: hypothetical protein RR865_04900 [Clostridia bacterium]
MSITTNAETLMDKLYELAFQFKKAKLWYKMNDSQLFAVRHSDGSIGYCCVMGMLGQHRALAVYPGVEGLDSFRILSKNNVFAASIAEQIETPLSQNCVMCSLQNKDALNQRELDEVHDYCSRHGLVLRGPKAHPQFERFRPFHYPWRITEANDQLHLLEAFEACLEVNTKGKLELEEIYGVIDHAPYDHDIPLLEKKNGSFEWKSIALPKPQKKQYPSAEIQDEIALAKLKKSKKTSNEWACDVLLYTNPICDEESDENTPAGEYGYVSNPTQPPYFPFLLIVVDNQTGMVMEAKAFGRPNDYAEIFANELLRLAINIGKPKRLLVCNERAYTLLDKFAAQLGVKLTMEENITLLNEAESAFSDRFPNDDDDGNSVYFTADPVAELVAILNAPDMLSAMPDEIFDQLMEISQEPSRSDIFTKEVLLNLQRESQKRKK